MLNLQDHVQLIGIFPFQWQLYLYQLPYYGIETT